MGRHQDAESETVRDYIPIYSLGAFEICLRVEGSMKKGKAFSFARVNPCSNPCMPVSCWGGFMSFSTGVQCSFHFVCAMYPVETAVESFAMCCNLSLCQQRLFCHSAFLNAGNLKLCRNRWGEHFMDVRQTKLRPFALFLQWLTRFN